MTSAETTYQTQDDGLEEVAVDSGETFWQGQFLQFTGNQTNASDVWAVRRVDGGEVGQLATELLLDGTGSATFSTSSLQGEYVIVDENERPVVVENGAVQGVGSVDEASFEVSQQTLNATFGDETVLNDDSSDARTDLRIESNRAGYNFSLTSDQLSASELADIFPDVSVRGDRAVSTRTASSDAVFDAEFSGVEPGTYNITVVAAGGTVEDAATINVTEPVEGTATLSNRTFEEQRGDVVEFNVTFEGNDRAQVSLGSRDVGYLVNFTVVDVDGDGVATVRFNSYRAGVSPDSPGISVVGEDNYTDFEMATDPTPGRLDAATYPIQLSVGTTRTDVGSILLSERSTGGIQVWTAPDTAEVDSAAAVNEVATQDQDIAYQDWVIVQVQASGLYGYVQNISDLNNNETGVSMNLTRLGAVNVPPEPVSLQQGELFVDESGDQFFLVFDSNSLEENATYHATFNVSSDNPYVEAGNETTLETNLSVVPRNVSFDRPVEVSASSGATISGSSSLAPGSELTIEAANVDRNPFLKSQTATVSEDGTWEATFDFSDVPAGTNFTVSTSDPQANATGRVVGDGGGAAAEATTTAAAEQTTANGEETVAAAEQTTEADGETTAEDGGVATDEETTEADEELGADEETTTEDEGLGADEETTEDDGGLAGGEETTTEDEGLGADEGGDEEAAAEDTTTTNGGDGSIPGFGPVAALVGLVVLLAGGAVASRRR